MKKSLMISVVLLLMVFSCKKEVMEPATVIPQTNDKYFPKVKIIIQNRCLSCHGSRGSFTGRPTAFDTDSSIAMQYQLIKAAIADPVSNTPFGNKRMPEDGPLSASDSTIIVKWYTKGGKTTD